MSEQGEKPTIEEVIDYCTLCLKGAQYQIRKAETENCNNGNERHPARQDAAQADGMARPSGEGHENQAILRRES